MTPLRLHFADFWPGFDPRDNWFTRLLAPHFVVELVDEPDFLIFSVYGHANERFRCPKICYIPENRRPNFARCDYAFSFDHLDHPRHFRLPNYVRRVDPATLVKAPDYDPAALLAAKTKFCNFVYSNCRPRVRNTFLRMLSKYKRVDCGGACFNNLGYRVQDKGTFLREYKFTIAFENSEYPGYTTEKLAEPMAADSLPLYWGNPLVGRDFNPGSFVSAYECGGLRGLVDAVVALDRDDDAYLARLREPWLPDNAVQPWQRPEAALEQFRRIFSGTLSDTPKPVLRPVGLGARVRAWATGQPPRREWA